jgi:hypothetical protein
MKRKPSPASIEEAQLIRLAWWASFFATVALIAILGLARSAKALTLPAGDPLATASAFVAAEDEESEDEEEGEYSECEFAEGEAEEEECEAEAEEDEAAQAPRECVLASASATVTAATNSDKVRLVIRYTAYSPGSIQISYWLRGGKGPLSLGHDRSHIGTHGVIRDTDTLSSAQMSRTLAARIFTIQLRPAHAPHACNHLLDRHLTVRKNASGRLTWSDPGPVLTAARQG